MHSNAVSVRSTAAPAYLDAIEAQAVLTDADRAVWQSLRSREAQFSGPGQVYEGDITTADQDLQQLAALEPSGSPPGKLLPTLSGQLVTYQGLVEQADAANRVDTASESPSTQAVSSRTLGDAYLGYAGQTVFGPGGLLPTVESNLSEPNRQALNGDLTSFWADPTLIAAIAIAGVVAFGLIVALQVFLRRRFHRSISPPLVLAAVVVCGVLAWVFAVVLPADNALARAQTTSLPRVVEIWQHQTQAVYTQALALQQSAGGNASDTAGGLNLPAVQIAKDKFDADLASAQTTGGLLIGIPVAIVVIAGLVFLAVKPRLDEYRGVDA